MAGGKLGFWSTCTNIFVAYLLCIFVIIMMAKLVNSFFFGTSSETAERVVEHTMPVGRVYYRDG